MQNNSNRQSSSSTATAPNVSTATTEKSNGHFQAGTKQASSVMPNHTLGKTAISAEKIGGPLPASGPKQPSAAAKINQPSVAANSSGQPIKSAIKNQPSNTAAGQSTATIPIGGNQPVKMAASNPFIPQLGRSAMKPSQLCIPSTATYTNVCSQSSPVESFASNGQFPMNSSQSAPIAGIYSYNLPYHEIPNSPVRPDPSKFQKSVDTNNNAAGQLTNSTELNNRNSFSKMQQIKIMHHHRINKVFPNYTNEKNRYLPSGNLPNLSLSPEEKESVQKIVDSLRIFYQKLTCSSMFLVP